MGRGGGDEHDEVWEPLLKKDKDRKVRDGLDSEDAQQVDGYGGEHDDVEVGGRGLSGGRATSGRRKIGYYRIFELAKPDFGVLCFATLALFISSVTILALPTFIGDVIDAVTNRSSTPEGQAMARAKVNTKLAEIMVVVVVGSVATSVRTHLFTAVSERIAARLKKNLFQRLLQQEIAFFDVTSTGELMSRLSEDTQIIKNAVTVNLSDAMRGLSTMLLGLIYMFVKSWKLTFLSLAIVPAVSVTIRFYGKYVKELSRKAQAAAAGAAAVAEECFGAVRTVRAFAQEDGECRRYEEKVDDSLQLGLKQAMVGGVFNGVMFAAATLSLVIVMWYGARLAIDGGMSPGTLASFIIYTLNVGFSMALLAGLYSSVMKAMGASERVFQLLDREPGMSKIGCTKPWGQERGGEVKLKGIWFAYPSRPNQWVLKGVNLTLHPGGKLALVGPSGGGKSTIANLVERFYDPQKGVVELDGCPLPDICHEYLHRQISIVSQEPVLFNTSISANIAYGSLPDTAMAMAEIMKAAKMAHAHDFISRFPSGYETLVGERGLRLSGGQKQRIAIARALLMNPRVLLLDEATSALDAESEYLVQDAMDRLMTGRTTLVIAHRLSTVQSAEIVAVVDKGVIVERGPHEELLRKNGVYASLVKRQLQGSDGNTMTTTTTTTNDGDDGGDDDGRRKDGNDFGERGANGELVVLEGREEAVNDEHIGTAMASEACSAGEEEFSGVMCGEGKENSNQGQNHGIFHK